MNCRSCFWCKFTSCIIILIYYTFNLPAIQSSKEFNLFSSVRQPCYGVYHSRHWTTCSHMLNNWSHVIRYLCLQRLMVRCFMYDFSIWQWSVFAYMCAVYTHLAACMCPVCGEWRNVQPPEEGGSEHPPTVPWHLFFNLATEQWETTGHLVCYENKLTQTCVGILTKNFLHRQFSVLFKQSRRYKATSLADSKWDLQLLLWADSGPGLAVTTCLSLC